MSVLANTVQRPERRGDALRLLHDARVVLDRKTQAIHLVLEERPRARCAAFVHGELRRALAFKPGDEIRALRPHRNHALRLGGEHAHALGDGGNILKHAHPRQRGGRKMRARARKREPRASQRPKTPLGVLHELRCACRRGTIVCLAQREQQFAIGGQRSHLHGRCAHIYA